MITIEKKEFSLDLVNQLIPLSVLWKKENITWGIVENTVDDFLDKDIFVAADNDKIVGYLLGHLKKDKHGNSFIQKSSNVYFIDELYVLPEYRNQGIGKQLYQLMENSIKEKSDYIELSCPTKDYRKALSFYIEQLGMDFYCCELIKKVEKNQDK